MMVHFIGAGPGAPDLITVRGLNLLRRAPVVLYAGSLIPEELVTQAMPGARIVNTAPLHLDQIVAEMEAASRAGEDVARLHSGDPALYGAIAEQMRRLDALGIPYDITPGVPAYAAAAAALGNELTLPGVSQTIVLTRTATRSSAMPPRETLAAFGATGATLAIHLSVNNLTRIARELLPHYGGDCPAIVVYRVSWPDQRIVRATLADIAGRVKDCGITRTALILVGRVLAERAFEDSRLYAIDHHHVLRPANSPKSAADRGRRASRERNSGR
jgi:precorrin-4/cobalt-precorrin-4 C11-methyltransferase